MAYKQTIKRKNLIEGDELLPAAAEIYNAYRADNRILGVKSTPLSDGSDIFEMWFDSEDTYTLYCAEIQALGNFRNTGVVTEKVELVDNVEFPGEDAMDSESIITEDDE